MRCKRELRRKIKNYCVKMIGNIIGHALIARTTFIVKLHNKLMIKPQALIRKFLVRISIMRARTYAFKFGCGIVTIQRFWRRNGNKRILFDNSIRNDDFP